MLAYASRLERGPAAKITEARGARAMMGAENRGAEKAVSAPLTVPHESIARQASGGIGGLYRLRFGDAASSVNRGAIWFSKPPAMTYPELDEALSSVLQRGAALWQRQLTLGPTPEFCLDFSGRPELPAGSQPIFISIEPLKG